MNNYMSCAYVMKHYILLNPLSIIIYVLCNLYALLDYHTSHKELDNFMITYAFPVITHIIIFKILLLADILPTILNDSHRNICKQKNPNPVW